MSPRHIVSPLLVSLIIPAAALAQGGSENVIITASRMPVASSAVGSAVTVLDGAVLQERQITTLYDALREVPGVAVSRTGTLGSLSQVRIRGGESNHTLVLIDGVEANDPAASSEFNFAHLMTAGIERVEILRGPQSALWGADAVSGVVNILTVAPRSGLFAHGDAEGGSFGTWAGSALVNTGGEQTAAVVDANYTVTAGNNIARTGGENDGYESLTLGARGFFRVSPAFEISGSLRHTNTRSEFDTGFPYPTDSDDYSKSNQTYGRVQGKFSLFNGVLNGAVAAALTDSRARNYSAGAFSDSLDGRKERYDVLLNGNWSGMAFGTEVTQRLSAAAETAREKFSQRFVTLDIADQKRTQIESGIAGEYWAGFGDTVFLSLGLRHDWNDSFADSTTWRTTLSTLLPGTPLRLHSSAGTGVKNPDFYELYGFVPSSFVGNPALTPEESFGYDFGVEATLFNNRALVDVTYFHADLQDEIFTDFAVFPSTALNATEDSSGQGLEILGRADLGGGFALSAAYTYTEARESGADELRRPHHIGSVDLDYRFMGDKAFVGLGVDFHGEQQDTDFGTFSQLTLPGYALLRVSGSYDIAPGIALTARVENALDESYEEVVGYRARGLGVFAGIRASIGE